MKTELTQTEKELIPVIRDKWIDIYNNNSTFTDEEVIKGIKWVYKSICKRKEPEVIIVDSPYACQMLAQELSGKKKYFNPCWNLSYFDSGWVSFYDYWTETGILDHRDFNKYRDIVKNGIYYTLTFENVAITSRPPISVIKNEEDVLHNVNGPSVIFKDGYSIYNINGRDIPEKLITSTFKKEDLIDEKNEDIKAAMVTIIKERYGDQGLLDFLEAVLVDEKTIKHTEDYSEIVRLYKTKETYSILQDRHGNMGQPYCWSEIVCPSTGQVYLIENSADFTNALEAVKWLRPSFVPSELLYTWENFAN